MIQSHDLHTSKAKGQAYRRETGPLKYTKYGAQVFHRHRADESLDSLVVSKQVVKFVLCRVQLPVAAIGEFGVDLGRLRDNHIYLRNFNIDSSGPGVGIRFIVRVRLVALILVVLVVFIGGWVVLHDRVEALESLHDVVHVHIKLVSIVVFWSRRSRSST